MTTSYQAKYSLRNVKVDSPANANDYLLETGQPQTKDNAAHVDAQAISISIQGTRITGRYEDAIREHTDGSYLRHYLSVKHKWTDSTWAWIDWYSHECHLKVLNGPVFSSGSSSSMIGNPPTPQKSSSLSPMMPRLGWKPYNQTPQSSAWVISTLTNQRTFSKAKSHADSALVKMDPARVEYIPLSLTRFNGLLNSVNIIQLS